MIKGLKRGENFVQNLRLFTKKYETNFEVFWRISMAILFEKNIRRFYCCWCFGGLLWRCTHVKGSAMCWSNSESSTTISAMATFVTPPVNTGSGPLVPCHHQLATRLLPPVVGDYWTQTAWKPWPIMASLICHLQHLPWSSFEDSRQVWC